MRILGWFIPPWFKWAAMALVLAATFASGFKVAGWRCDAAKAAALEAAQKHHDKQLAEAHAASADYERSRERGQAESRQRETRVREIYREIEVPSECAAPPAVRGLLDDAIRAANGNAPRESGAAVPPAS